MVCRAQDCQCPNVSSKSTDDEDEGLADFAIVVEASTSNGEFPDHQSIYAENPTQQ